MDLTEGNIFRRLISYSVPLVLGNLFQLAYNAVDSMIAGNFIGTDALAATGQAGPVMNILILGISGLCIGAGVLMSSFFGGGDLQKLKKTLSTLLVFGTVFSSAVAGIGFAAAYPLLRVMNVPSEILDITVLYIRIIFIGVPFTYFYNALSQALKSVGDSKTPLKFLMISSLINGLADLFLIGYLGFGIMCSAITTVAAEIISAALCFFYIRSKVPVLRISAGEFRIDRILLRKTLSYGSVTALQQACQPVGKLLIQGAVNTLGVASIAAYSAAVRVDDFALVPEQQLSHGVTTFVAQNRGAGNRERMIKGFRAGLAAETAYFAIICIAVLLLKSCIMPLFISGEDSMDVIREGEAYLSLMAFFYIFPAYTNCIQGFFRGVGNMSVTLLSTFIQTSVRVVCTFILVPHYGIHAIAYACAIGWSMMLLFEVPYYFLYKRKYLEIREIS